ncbi:MAG: hypothetical protein J7L57_00915 [Deltaproteobacteria bacterium]|nr:hypothetical protein [Candidatus Tharpella sp.]
MFKQKIERAPTFDALLRKSRDGNDATLFIKKSKPEALLKAYANVQKSNY